MTAPRPLVFLLHALGSSAGEWDEVVARLGHRFDGVALDLPGFGERGTEAGVDVADRVDWLAGEIRSRAPAAYMLVGHSLSAKLCSILARRAEDGEAGLSGLEGVVLVAGSPPSPEPMTEDAREEMIGWARTGPIGEADAQGFVKDNVAGPLPPETAARAVADVRRSDPFSWRAWLERGAREDWNGFVGRLATPAILLAGAEDADLGEDAQRRLNLPHYARGRLVVVERAAHLIPYERPDAVADAIDALWSAVAPAVLPQDYARLLPSRRVSARTRKALLDRRHGPDPEANGYLGPARLATLRALLEAVLPHGRSDIDLARRIDVALAAGEGDGWRFAALPPDREAWSKGLDTLDAVTGGYARLPPRERHAALAEMAAGALGSHDEGRLDPAQMKLWFEDVRAEAVRAWLGCPAALAQIGYDGFANGGDAERQQGFVRTGADDPEPWEPARAPREGARA